MVENVGVEQEGKRITEEDYKKAVEVQKQRNIGDMNKGSLLMYGIPVVVAVGLIIAGQL